ncbi:diphosphate--fructose-6-phosphate 1-phosphotransferase [Halalkalibacter alkaliphilus]|uniref:Diphosphate--fructose-6-phosphate 1-phosphotransferase n=1 Tax=Halalkalibacter alkaliphilus TaxID=2917993 RepID=A0A9X2CV54_9BACI|nr:diphosphate--fructose-6-phosphate 1-phosphotransferase [Halalkalibacter alkaliphilus]MCL7748857.1 diphosphate--fructose-6-phosphate 1-phosphotransferase [Halalkalibacter alkaliphilus]
MRKKILIGQAGGPTAVINASLAAFVEELSHLHHISYIVNGYEGLANNNIVNGTDALHDQIIQHRNVPGACLGSGRYPSDETAIKKSLKTIMDRNVDVLVMIGGNGTMAALAQIEQLARENKYKLQVIGIPKTVDNDLGGTDHAPGFASAASYVAQSCVDNSRDLMAMNNFEQVRIIETMGRNSGWLAAASGFFTQHVSEGPHYIGLPEKSFDLEEFLEVVKSSIDKYGYCLAVVSEGVRLPNGLSRSKEVNGREVLGGVAETLKCIIEEGMGVNVRAETLGINQRCLSLDSSSIDFQEAEQCGTFAAKLLQNNITGVMVSFSRGEDSLNYMNLIDVPLRDVLAAGERKLPDEFIKDLPKYYKWLSPLIAKNHMVYPTPIIKGDVYAET